MKIAGIVSHADKVREFCPCAVYNLKVPKNRNHIKIIPLGDIQAGQHVHEEELKNMINYIVKARAYTVLMGDLMEAVVSSFHGEIFKQKISPSKQLVYLKELLKPLKGRVLAVVPGNHEKRLMSKVDWNPMKELADSLDAPYMEWSGFVEVTLNNKYRYVIYLTHGWGGARTKGGRLNKLHWLSVGNDADVYLMGHEHDVMVDRDSVRFMEDGKVKMRKRYFCFTGYWHVYEGGFMDEKQILLGVVGAPKIKLFSNKWDLHAEI